MFDSKLSLFKLIKQINNTNSVIELNYSLLRYHPLAQTKKEELVNKVIKSQHPKLYDELNQNLGVKVEYIK